MKNADLKINFLNEVHLLCSIFMNKLNREIKNVKAKDMSEVLEDSRAYLNEAVKLWKVLIMLVYSELKISI